MIQDKHIIDSVQDKQEDPSFPVISEQENFLLSFNREWLTYWSLPILGSILLLFLLAAWWIQFPEVVDGTGILAAENAPKEVIFLQQGKIIQLFSQNNSYLSKGQTIAWVESDADHQEVLDLSDRIVKSIHFLQSDSTEKLLNLFTNSYQHLGNLQVPYQQFINSLQQFSDYLVNGFYLRRKRALQQDLKYLKDLDQNIRIQKDLSDQDLSLTEETYAANLSLYKDSLIASQEYRDQKSRLLNKQLSKPQMEAALLSNRNQQVNKTKDIEELEHTIAQQKLIFMQALQTLEVQVDEWKKKYVISAPEDGNVIYMMRLQVNQFIKSNTVVGYINPKNSRYFAQMTLPQHNLGKVALGQRVQLRLEAYPYQDFGILEGRLDYISSIPSDSGFLANILLPNGLTTNMNKKVQFRPGLVMQASVMIQEQNLIKKLFKDLTHAH